MLYLVPPRPGERIKTWISAEVECEDPAWKSRLQNLVNEHLGEPPEEKDDGP